MEENEASLSDGLNYNLNVNPIGEDIIHKDIKDYDREITEKIRSQYPELFVEIPDESEPIEQEDETINPELQMYLINEQDGKHKVDSENEIIMEENELENSFEEENEIIMEAEI